jgi:hypothetical protein
VDVLTDLDITGKPAQFGRGVMVDVGNKLIGQFAECLAGKLTEGATPDAPATPLSESPTSPMETAVSDATPTAPTPRPRPRKAAADSAAAAADADKVAPVKASTKASAAKAAPAKSSAAKAAPAKAAQAPAAESGAAASSAAAATASTATTSAAVPEPDEPQTTEPTAADPVAEETVAAVTPLPTRTAAAPRRPADDVEPINLIESAGPALAKRLAPIIALVVLLILIARRRRH